MSYEIVRKITRSLFGMLGYYSYVYYVIKDKII